jgi:Na+-driven multidrug efflux pump
MTSASIVLGVTGIALSFFPQEITTLLNAHITTTLTVILQLLGSLYFGFAMLNWLAKDSLLGGIYNRPIVVANVTHFVIGALALLKVLSQNQEMVIWIMAIGYAFFAILFSLVMYKNPEKKEM